MGNRGTHNSYGGEHARFVREERESLRQLAEANREDAVADARRWAGRLARGDLGVRDASMGVVKAHVLAMLHEIDVTAALAKWQDKTIAKMRADLSHAREIIRNRDRRMKCATLKVSDPSSQAVTTTSTTEASAVSA